MKGCRAGIAHSELSRYSERKIRKWTRQQKGQARRKRSQRANGAAVANAILRLKADAGDHSLRPVFFPSRRKSPEKYEFERL